MVFDANRSGSKGLQESLIGLLREPSFEPVRDAELYLRCSRALFVARDIYANRGGLGFQESSICLLHEPSFAAASRSQALRSRRNHSSACGLAFWKVATVRRSLQKSIVSFACGGK